MLLTLYYTYATIMQWWRLRHLGNKLKNTINPQNALLVCSGKSLHSTRRQRCFENLLLKSENRVACTVVPRQKINLTQWVSFPRNNRHFPIYIEDRGVVLGVDGIFVMLQTFLGTFTKRQSEILQMETLGELVGWRVNTDHFEVMLKMDVATLTTLVHNFVHNEIDLNHHLNLLKLELVDIEGATSVIKYEHKYRKEEIVRYSCAPIHWSRFVHELKDLYSKIREINNPTIKIENGTPKCFEKTPKIVVDEPKNTLEVAPVSEHRRHKQKKPNKPKIPKKKEVSVVETKPKQGGAKPPNVLVYSDSAITKDNVKRLLFSILNKEKYIIYDLPTSSHWNKSTVLVVVCGNVPPELTSSLIQFLLNGGQLLCLCSDLMYSVLHTYATAEVREHELVRFSYDSWTSVKMMHHVFCYQASPAKKQFSKDSDQSNHSNGSSPLAAPRTPSHVDFKHNDKDYQILVEVLGTEETWHTPSILLANIKNSGGKAVFSQVHLEIDPEMYEHDEEKFESLKQSNSARIAILGDLLQRHLGISCDDNTDKLQFSPGYFLGRYDAKMEMVSQCENISQNQLTCDKISVVFCGYNLDPGESSNIRLPVLIHSCPPNFSTLHYFETLNTSSIGRLVIYADLMTSSQHLLAKKLRHGLVIIPKQQSNGVGRSQNVWLSPPGSASFSLQLHIPLHSKLGEALPLVQHLIIVALVSALRNQSGCEKLALGIKWPNDLYANESVKIGGIVANSTILGNLAIVNIGCGINLANENPTTSLTTLMQNLGLESLSYEKYFALVFNEIERLYDLVQESGTEILFPLYYQYWLHGDANVTIQNDRGVSQSATVVGLDQFGFLTVRLENNKITSVQPDGNSFDMLNGLIAPKIF